MKITAQIYSDKLTALQGKGIGEHGTFWKLGTQQSGFADTRYQNAPDLTAKPMSAKKLLNTIEYAAQKQVHNMETALTSRDQIFAELAKPKPSMVTVMKHVNAITQSGVPLNSIPWKVTPSPSGSGSGAQGLRLDPMAMVGAVFNGAVSMLARLENGEVPLVEDNPSFKSRPDDLKAALQALKKGLTETLASNPPANTSANTSANSSANTSASAVGGNAAPTRSRGLGTSVVTQPLPPSQAVATGQPQPQGVQTGGQGAPTAPSAQGTSESLSVLKLREEIADLEVVVQTHEVDPSKVSRAQADLAKKQVNALEAKINRIKAEEAIAAARSSTTTTTTATTAATTTTTATNAGTPGTMGTNPFLDPNPFLGPNPFLPSNSTGQ